MFSIGIMILRVREAERDRRNEAERETKSEIIECTHGNNAGTTTGQQRLRVIYLIFPYSAASSPLCGTPGSSFLFPFPSREFMGKVTAQ